MKSSLRKKLEAGKKKRVGSAGGGSAETRKIQTEKIAIVEEIVGTDKEGRDVIDRIVDPEDGIFWEDRVVKGKRKRVRVALNAIPRDMMGQPTVMTSQTLAKLELWLKVGCTVKEACTKAGISPVTYYDYAKKNPDFSNTAKAWMEDALVSDAKLTIARAARHDANIALEVLKAKRKGEGWGGQPVFNGPVQINFSEEVKKRTKKYEPKPNVIETTAEEA